jgi:hypothetical protein
MASSDAWNRTAFYFFGTLPATPGYMRRHLSTDQRAMIAEKIANMPQGGDRKSEEIKNTDVLLISKEQAAAQLSTTPKAISR